MHKLVTIEPMPMPMPMPMQKKTDIIAFTDGACVQNGKPGAKGAFAVVWPEHPHLNFAAPLSPNEKQTNNRAELRGVLGAIEKTNTYLPESREAALVIYTDSMLIINTVTKWMPSWKRKGWLKADGQPVANIDLLQMLDGMLSRRRVTFRFVRAHTNNNDFASNYNRVVDGMATGVLHNRLRF